VLNCYFSAILYSGVNLMLVYFHISINSRLIQLKLHVNFTTGIYLSFIVYDYGRCYG